MDTLITVIALIVILKLFSWGQMSYWSSPAFREDLKRWDNRHGGMRHA